MKKKKPTSLTFNLIIQRAKLNARSLILGLLSVVIVIMLLIKVLPVKVPTNNQQQATPTPSAQQQTNNDKIQTTTEYTIQEGDNLWSIAEKFYGSGFNAYDLASANNITQPNIIDVGRKIMIPNLQAKQPTQGEITDEAAFTQKEANLSTDNSQKIKQYTVQQGDFLWSIAEKAYGNGEQWVKIAQANNINAPYIIYSGNQLAIP